MKIRENRIILYCLLMCVITGCIVYSLAIYQTKKIGVVDAIKLFDSYNMKLELEAQAKIKLQKEGGQLDSIENKFKMAQAAKNDSDIKMLGHRYNTLKAILQNDFKEGNKEINVQIWKRLNPLVEAYGKQNHLHLIIGANGMGTVLYEDSYFDMTDDMIKFVNKKYEEGN
jgi:outer membrane protein